jgi:membrane-bound lytic murein transglycosylase D
MIKHKLLFTIIASFVLSIASFGAAAPSLKLSNKELFPTGPLIERKIKFWESIFNDYTSDQLVIHDLLQPDLVLGVVPFVKGTKQSMNTYPKIYDEAIADFVKLGMDAKALSPLHKRIWSAYAKDDRAQSRLLSGRVDLRTQLGLADIFHAAALRAQKYLPKMEKIFADHDLPIEITRLPFVESMFQIEARSKVGAAGLWQLMPSAAKPHLVVNRNRDERGLPLKATFAAAKIMRANYKALGTWPLAITAYNHGTNGVARGVKQIKSTNLADLILSYRSSTFGFASKNFYAEFLAAHRAYAKWQIAQKSRNKDKHKRVALAD